MRFRFMLYPASFLILGSLLLSIGCGKKNQGTSDQQKNTVVAENQGGVVPQQSPVQQPVIIAGKNPAQLPVQIPVGKELPLEPMPRIPSQTPVQSNIGKLPQQVGLPKTQPQPVVSGKEPGFPVIPSGFASGTACSQAINQRVTIGGYLGGLVPQNGALDVSLVGPGKLGGATMADFQGQQAGYAGAVIRQGKTVIGQLNLDQNQVIITLPNSGETFPVGVLVDSQPNGTSYPRKARIQFGNGACLVQYRTQSGDLFSSGAGYLVLP